MENLPAEVLCIIFRYLSYNDIKAARLICTKFYNVLSAPKFTKNEVLKINNRMLKKDPKFVHSLYSSSRQFYKCEIKDTTFNFGLVQAFVKIGAHLREVKFEKCPMTEKQFKDCVTYCQKLETLHVIGCENLLIPGKLFYAPSNIRLNYLKELHLSDTIYMTDYILCKFMEICPNLEYLSIKNISINSHQGVFGFFYSASISSPLENPSANVCTFVCMRDLVKTRMKMIKGFDLTGTGINNAILAEILQLKRGELKYLNVSRCLELKKDPALSIGLWQPNITELNLSYCDLVTDTALMDICYYMRGLITLNISNCKHVTSVGVENFSMLPHLSDLDVSSCMLVTGHSLALNLFARESPAIKILNIGCVDVQDNDLTFMATSNAKLSELQIENYLFITEESIRVLFNYQRQFSKLVLAGLYITDTAFVTLEKIDAHTLAMIEDELDKIKVFLRRKRFNLLQKKIYFNIVYSLINSQYDCMINLTNVKTLSLRNSRELTDKILIYSVCMDELIELNLSNTLVTKLGLFFLVFKCPNIETLDLSFCDIDDSGVNIIAQGLKNLKHLYLKECIRLTDESLKMIIQYCTSLKLLDLESCCNMSNCLLRRIQEMPTLVEIIGRPDQQLNTGYMIPPAPEMPNFI